MALLNMASQKDKNLVNFDENKSQYGVRSVPNENILRKDGFHLFFPFLGTAGATAANYDVVFTAYRPFEVVSITASWSVASSSGTLQLERLTGTQAPGAGSVLISTTASSVISTAGTANTANTRSGLQLTSARQFTPGDRLGLIDGGTLTGLVGLNIVLYCRYVNFGDYI